jgi:hypothetical protein
VFLNPDVVLGELSFLRAGAVRRLAIEQQNLSEQS